MHNSEERRVNDICKKTALDHYSQSLSKKSKVIGGNLIKENMRKREADMTRLRGEEGDNERTQAIRRLQRSYRE